jgi:hypothetical protein
VMSRTWTSGRQGVPSLMIGTLPLVKAHAAKLVEHEVEANTWGTAVCRGVPHVDGDEIVVCEL